MHCSVPFLHKGLKHLWSLVSVGVGAVVLKPIPCGYRATAIQIMKLGVFLDFLHSLGVPRACWLSSQVLLRYALSSSSTMVSSSGLHSPTASFSLCSTQPAVSPITLKCVTHAEVPKPIMFLCLIKPLEGFSITHRQNLISSSYKVYKAHMALPFRLHLFPFPVLNASECSLCFEHMLRGTPMPLLLWSHFWE